MSGTSKHVFKWRSFTSLYITISFLVMIFSGSVLYIAPPGRIAKWTHIFIEQTIRQPYLTINIDQSAVASYALNVNDVQCVIEDGINNSYNVNLTCFADFISVDGKKSPIFGKLNI